MRQRVALNATIGPLMRYLSPTHEVASITNPAKPNGGATRHCAAAIEKPILCRRMMGRKNPIPVALVTTPKKINAKPQTFGSRPEEAHLLKFQGSGSTSSRSLESWRMTKLSSRSFRKRQDFFKDRSGKSIRKKYPTIPTTQVNIPSIMNIHLQPDRSAKPFYSGFVSS
jgi:hypothetical protein